MIGSLFPPALGGREAPQEESFLFSRNDVFDRKSFQWLPFLLLVVKVTLIVAQSFISLIGKPMREIDMLWICEIQVLSLSTPSLFNVWRRTEDEREKRERRGAAIAERGERKRALKGSPKREQKEQSWSLFSTAVRSVN